MRRLGRHVPPRESLVRGRIAVGCRQRRDPADRRRYEPGLPGGSVSGTSGSTAGGGFGWTSERGQRASCTRSVRSGDIAATSINTGLGAGHMAFARRDPLGREPRRRDDHRDRRASPGPRPRSGSDHPVTTIAAGQGRLLVGVEEGRSVEDSINGLTGDVAKLIAYKGEIEARGHGARCRTGGVPDRVRHLREAPELSGRTGPGRWELRPEVADRDADRLRGRTHVLVHGPKRLSPSRLPRTSRSPPRRSGARSSERSPRGSATKPRDSRYHRRHRGGARLPRWRRPITSPGSA